MAANGIFSPSLIDSEECQYSLIHHFSFERSPPFSYITKLLLDPTPQYTLSTSSLNRLHRLLESFSLFFFSYRFPSTLLLMKYSHIDTLNRFPFIASFSSFSFGYLHRNENTIMRSIRPRPFPRPSHQADWQTERPSHQSVTAIPAPTSLPLQQPIFHKRTYSDCQTSEPAGKGIRRHQRSSSQIFTTGPVQEKSAWGRRTITEVEDEDCSESEEVIRRILRERGQRGESRGRPVESRESSLLNMRSCMSQLLSIQAEETKRTELARARLKREILGLVQGQLSESSRGDSPETVITLKSSAASVTTVVEAHSESEGPASEDTAIPVEEDKESEYELDLSVTFCSDADNTVITDQEAAGGASASGHAYWEVIRGAIASLCFSNEIHSLEALFRLLEDQCPSSSFVLAFLSPPYRRQIWALYELLASQMLRKVYGRRDFPERVGPEEVRDCYFFDSGLGVFRLLHTRRVGSGVHAVVLM